MPLAQRRPALLKLTLPHPPLSCLSTSNNTTNQPSEPNPITPVHQRRETILPSNRNSRCSVDSWCSSVSNDSTSMAPEYEWTPAQIQILCKTLDDLPSHLFTPYVGEVPPLNILHKLARGVKDARGSLDWPHSLRSTRQMLHSLATQLALPSTLPSVVETPPGGSPPMDATNSPQQRRRPTINKVPLYRQNSMDDLVPDTCALREGASTKENAGIERASTRLQRADRFFTFHPYASAKQRHSTVSNGTALSDPTGETKAPLESFSPVTFRRALRRTASSTSSQLAPVNENVSLLHFSQPAPPGFNAVAAGNPVSQLGHRTSNPSIQRVPRPDSCHRPLSMGATIFADDVTSALAMDLSGPSSTPTKQTLKRAPSYGAVAQRKKEEVKATKAASPEPKKIAVKVRPPSPSVCSSDEEEKRRSKTVKRKKTMDRPPSWLGDELPLKPQPQTITVEEYTLSMESLPSLSTSSSATRLSTKSIETMRTRTSSKASSSSSSSSSRDRKSSKKAKSPTPPPPVPPLPPQYERATSHSPPRTLRRVGNKSVVLEDRLTTVLASPSLPPMPPAQSSKRPNALTHLSRTISFGTSDREKKRNSGASLLGAALGLNSPFEEKPLPSKKGMKKYLF